MCHVSGCCPSCYEKYRYSRQARTRPWFGGGGGGGKDGGETQMQSLTNVREGGGGGGEGGGGGGWGGQGVLPVERRKAYSVAGYLLIGAGIFSVSYFKFLR
jgi:hypothetical protein